MPVIQIENYYLVTDKCSIEKVDKALLFSSVTVSQDGLFDTYLSPALQNLHGFVLILTISQKDIKVLQFLSFGCTHT